MQSPYVFCPEYLQYRLLSDCPVCGNGVFKSENSRGQCRTVTYSCDHKWVQIGVDEGSLNQDDNGYYPNLPPTVVHLWFVGHIPLELEVTGSLGRHELRKDDRNRLKDAKRYLNSLNFKMGRRERAAFVEAYAAKGLTGLISLINQLVPSGIDDGVDILRFKMTAVAMALLS